MHFLIYLYKNNLYNLYEESVYNIKNYGFPYNRSYFSNELNFQQRYNYFLGCFRMKQEFQPNNSESTFYFPETGTTNFEYLNLIISHSTGYTWTMNDGGVLYEDQVYDNIPVPLDVVYPSYLNGSLENREILSFPNINSIRYLADSQYITKLWNKNYKIYYHDSDEPNPELGIFESINMTRYFLFINFQTNKMSWGIQYELPDNDRVKIWKYGIINYEPPITLSESTMYYGISRNHGNKTYISKKCYFYFDGIDNTLDPQDGYNSQIINWLKRIPI